MDGGRRKKKTRKKRGGMTLEEKKNRIEKLKEEMQEIWWNEKNKQYAADFIHDLRHSLRVKREELTRLKQEVLAYSGGPEMSIVDNNPNPGGSRIKGGKRRKSRTKRRKKKTKKRRKKRKWSLKYKKSINCKNPK